VATGRVRVEAFQETLSAKLQLNAIYNSDPFWRFSSDHSAGQSARDELSEGIACSSSPTGSFTVPDVSLNSSGPVTVAIQAEQHSDRHYSHTRDLFGKRSDQTITSTALGATLSRQPQLLSVVSTTGIFQRIR